MKVKISKFVLFLVFVFVIMAPIITFSTVSNDNIEYRITNSFKDYKDSKVASIRIFNFYQDSDFKDIKYLYQDSY